MVFFGFYVKTVNILVFTPKIPTFSRSRLLQCTKLAITIHLCTLVELTIHAFTLSNVLALHKTFGKSSNIDRTENDTQSFAKIG